MEKLLSHDEAEKQLFLNAALRYFCEATQLSEKEVFPFVNDHLNNKYSWNDLRTRVFAHSLNKRG